MDSLVHAVETGDYMKIISRILCELYVSTISDETEKGNVILGGKTCIFQNCQ